MPHSRRSFLAGGVAWAARPASVGPGVGGGLRLGTVSLRSCFDQEKYGRVAEAMDRMRGLNDRITQEAAEIRKAIAELSSMMEAMNRRGDLYFEKARMRSRAEYDLKLLEETHRRRLHDRLEDLESRVNVDIRRVLAGLAQSQNLDLVLRSDGPALRETGSEAGLAPREYFREILFHADAVDLTPQVLALLNAEWAKAWTCAGCGAKSVEEACPECGAKKP